jgi:beta-glucanase (GH16 family)
MAQWQRTGALALAATLAIGMVGEVSQPVANADSTVTSSTAVVLRDDFEASALDSTIWRPRLTNTQIGNRLCSVPVEKNNAVGDGSFRSSVTKSSSKTAKTLIKLAKVAQRKAHKRAVGCPLGTYDYSMVSTEETLAVKYGTLSARIKFPPGQGLHGSVWLRSTSVRGGAEIDMVEAFGYGKGITNFVFVPDGKGGNKKYPTTGGYVLKSQTKKRAWWNQFHTFSVTWKPVGTTHTSFVFSVDGEVTREMVLTVADAEYFVVMSNIVSTWEMKYYKHPQLGAPGVKKTKLPQTMLVDWVELISEP